MRQQKERDWVRDGICQTDISHLSSHLSPFAASSFPESKQSLFMLSCQREKVSSSLPNYTVMFTTRVLDHVHPEETMHSAKRRSNRGFLNISKHGTRKK